MLVFQRHIMSDQCQDLQEGSTGVAETDTVKADKGKG